VTNYPIPASGAMEGGGAYNKHARLPASGGALALPHFINAAEKLPLGAGNQPIVIADYGSSQGRNSLAPIRRAIEVLRTRAGSERPILVYHEDLPANDFNALFELLDEDPESYALNGANVFPCAIGRSFYQSVLPPDHVHLGWSSYAAMWISRVPTQIPDHFFVPRSTGEVRAAFERQGAEDWTRFLSLRANELRAGGRLVVTVPGADEGGLSGHEGIMDDANATLVDMVADGTIAAEERARMVIGVWPRSRRDLLAPFADGERFAGLRAELCETKALPDAAWADYQRDRDGEALAKKHAQYFRAIFAPTLAGALDRNRTPDRVRAFSDRLEAGLERRRAHPPAPINSLVATIVITKSGAT